MVKPASARGEITIIAITTIGAWNSGPGKDSALDRRFIRTELGEAPPEDSFQIMKNSLPEIAGPNASFISDEILKYMIEVSCEIAGRALPDRAMQVLREVVASMNGLSSTPVSSDMSSLLDMLAQEIRYLELGQHHEARKPVLEYRRSRAAAFQPAVTREDVQAAVVKLTGAPPWEQVRARVAQPEEDLAERIIGQRPAISAVCRVLRRAAVGLKNRLRPIGSAQLLDVSPSTWAQSYEHIKKGILEALMKTLSGTHQSPR